VVPGEGFEPPTFGLQNRCTTTVLTRLKSVFQYLIGILAKRLAPYRLRRPQVGSSSRGSPSHKSAPAVYDASPVVLQPFGRGGMLIGGLANREPGGSRRAREGSLSPQPPMTRCREFGDGVVQGGAPVREPLVGSRTTPSPEVEPVNVKRSISGGSVGMNWAMKIAAAELLLEEDPHCLEVEGYCIGLEEIVADHACEVEAKAVFPWERPIVEARQVVCPRPTE
jgi:hypothetical protein